MAQLQSLFHMLNQRFLRRHGHVEDIRIFILLMLLYEARNSPVVSPQIIRPVIELVDTPGKCHLQLVVRDPASAVKHKRKAVRRSMDRIQAVDVQVRRPFVEAVSIANRDCQKVDSGILLELLCSLRPGIEIQV